MHAPVSRVTLYPQEARLTRRLVLSELPPDGRVVWEDLGENTVAGSFRMQVVEGEARLLSLPGVQAEVLEVASPPAELADWRERGSELEMLVAILDEWRTRLCDQPWEDSQQELSPEQHLEFGIRSQEALQSCLSERDLSAQEICRELTEINLRIRQVRSETATQTRFQLETLLESPGGPLVLELSYRVHSAGWNLFYQLDLARPARQGELSLWAEVNQSTGKAWDGAEITFYTVPSLNEPDLPELSSLQLGRATRDLNGATRPPLASAFQLLDDYLGWHRSHAAELPKPDPVPQRPARILECRTAATHKSELCSMVSHNPQMARTICAPVRPSQVTLEVPFLDYDQCRLDGVGGDRRGRLYSLEQPEPPLAAPSLPGRSFRGQFPLRLEGDGRKQRILLCRLPLEVELGWRCTPALDAQVYASARFLNPLPQGLAPAPLRILDHGVFVRESQLADCTAGDWLEIGLGAEPSLSLQRREHKSAEKGQETLSRNFSVEIDLTSSYAEEVEIRVQDWLPVSEDVGVKVKLIQDPGCVEGPNGALIWKVSLIPGEHKQLNYRYRCQFPSTQELVWR